ncbi:MAG: DUF4189 domain-containing protein [Alphaproteobacteria bacterium]|nr:DUF4189 domain-containing protein [Alphaproteobacteria bacterium]
MRICLSATAALALFTLALAPSGSADAAGAIASGECGAYGTAWNSANPAEARLAALERCTGHGGRGCSVVLEFENSCGALAIEMADSCGTTGWVSRSDLGEAQNTAIEACQNAAGGRECVTRAWACDTVSE